MKEKRLVELTEEQWDFLCRIIYDMQISRQLKGYDSESLDELLSVLTTSPLLIQIY